MSERQRQKGESAERRWGPNTEAEAVGEICIEKR